MRIGEVIGRVTLSKRHANLPAGGGLKVVLPMPLEALADDSPRRGEEVILFDELGAGAGALVGISEGREAANPFGKVRVPIDAYCACLLDRINL